jgi:hypothetical protein
MMEHKELLGCMNSLQRWVISSITKRKIIWILHICPMVLVLNLFPNKYQLSIIIKENS